MSKICKIVFLTSDWDIIHRIQDRFGIPNGITVNGMTINPCEIQEEDWELLQETAQRGFIRIMKHDND